MNLNCMKMKSAQQKGLYAIWFCFYEILKKTKLFNRKQIIVPRMWGHVCVCWVPADFLQPQGTVAHQPPLSMGFFQARILEWVAISCSRGSSWPGIETVSPELAGRSFTTEPLKKGFDYKQAQGDFLERCSYSISWLWRLVKGMNIAVKTLNCIFKIGEFIYS